MTELTVLDRLEIIELQSIYAWGIDGKDGSLFAHAFTEDIETDYGHLDSTSTLAATTTGSGRRGLKRVRDDLYVENLGHGNRRFVWVVWTDRSVRHGCPAVWHRRAEGQVHAHVLRPQGSGAGRHGLDRI